MQVSDKFKSARRQPYITEAAYKNTLAHFDEDYIILQKKFKESEGNRHDRSRVLHAIADTKWFAFQLKFTAGEKLEVLATELAEIVSAFEVFIGELSHVSDDQYQDPFVLDDVIDVYVDYINILCCAILLHREDLIPRVFSFIEGTAYDGSDAVIEELLKLFLAERPAVDGWIWDKPYDLLVSAIDEPENRSRGNRMAEYVNSWYCQMKGKAHFWGKHEEIDDTFSPYNGYWAMCAAAFTYLYGMDDSAYREKLVYPRDLVDYARSKPRIPVELIGGAIMLRVMGGQSCPSSGMWFSPAKSDSATHFSFGDLMPEFSFSEYGATIWQWISE